MTSKRHQSRTVEDTDQRHVCEDEEVKAGMEAVVLQPRHSIKKRAIAKLAAHCSHKGGHEQTTDGISNLFADLATSAVGSSKNKGPWGEMKGEEGVEITTGKDGKGKRWMLRITQAQL